MTVIHNSDLQMMITHLERVSKFLSGFSLTRRSVHYEICIYDTKSKVLHN